MLSFLLSTLLPFTHLEVEEVSFEGKKMQLKGPFVWEHTLGRLSGKNATAIFDDPSYKNLPIEISLPDGIEFTTFDGDNLKSPFAFINSLEKKGMFHGTENQKVQLVKGDKSFEIEGLQMQVSFDNPSNQEHFSIQEVKVEQAVTIRTKDDFIFVGDLAIFKGFKNKGKFSNGFLFSNQPFEKTCIISSPNIDIKAYEVELELQQKKVIVKGPEGKINTHGQILIFSTDHLIIDDEKIELQPPVELQQESNRIVTEGKVSIIRGGEEKILAIICEGPSKIYFKEKESGKEHFLTTHGKITIDNKNHQTICENSGDQKQIHFKDSYGEVFADKAILKYELKQKHLVPTKLSLEGNVKMIHLSESIGQYALADKADFSFEKNTLALKAYPKKRVLFYDQLNKMEASAPGITIQREAKSQKTNLKGMGDVRFVFAEDEFNELKRRFSL